MSFYEWLADTVRARVRSDSGAEQLGRGRWSCGGSRRRKRRDNKRSAVRLMRRAAKRFLDDAPKRITFRGWAD